MKLLIFTSIFLLAAAVAGAQTPTQTIRGKVIDEASRAPIPFATVVLLNTDPLQGTTTDGDGIFKIEQVAVGRYDLRVSFTGYEAAVVRELLVSSSKEVALTISLKESIATLGEVVVNARVNKEEPLNAMATVSARMLSVEEASRYAGGFDDPARLASSFAGVTSNVANNGIVVRGNAPKSLQWKLEGIEIPNPNHFADLSAFGGGGLTALSSQMLANSDFFTGAFPAEYSNALSGVFDIFMRSGNNEQAEHTFQLGIIGIDASSEGPLGQEGSASYLFNYRYSTLALVAPLLPEEAQGTRYQDLSYKLSFPTQKSGRFSLWGIGLLDRSGQLARTSQAEWRYRQDRETSDAKQFMSATGLSHSYSFGANTQLETSLAATVSGLNWQTERMNDQARLVPQSQIEHDNWNFVLTSSLNRKFSGRHTNKTGFTLTGLHYNMLLKDAGTADLPLQTLVDERGFSSLLSAYTSSSIHFSNNWTLNAGLSGQFFTLNKHYTLEPRLGLQWQLDEKQQLGLAYGLHSRLEKLHYYFTKVPGNGDERVNQNMDFTKAHHLVLSYGRRLSEKLSLKVEPYFQYLFSVPVIADSSFSFINLQGQWFIPHQLENTGRGRNWGVDLTLEHYLAKGYYFLATTSLFNSEYRGGDGLWRNTRFNRNYVVNLLAGKEWFVGRNAQNVVGLNTRFTVQGGDRFTPVDGAASLEQQAVVYNEGQAFTQQTSPALLAHFTASYKLNRARRAHEFSLKILNATMHSDFFGFRYNYLHNTVDEHRETIMIPNLSYKLEF